MGDSWQRNNNWWHQLPHLALKVVLSIHFIAGRVIYYTFQTFAQDLQVAPEYRYGT
jgi:hypothetical protein